MFHSYFERKSDKVLSSNNVHFLNFEISAAHFQNSIRAGRRLIEEIRYLFLKTEVFWVYSFSEEAAANRNFPRDA